MGTPWSEIDLKGVKELVLAIGIIIKWGKVSYNKTARLANEGRLEPPTSSPTVQLATETAELNIRPHVQSTPLSYVYT